MAESVTYETLQNGKIKELRTYTRPNGRGGTVEVTEKDTFRLSEAESTIASQISNFEAQRDTIDTQIADLKKKRDDLAALRAV